MTNTKIFTLSNPATGDLRTFQPLNDEVGYYGSRFTTITDLRALYQAALRVGFTELTVSEQPEYAPSAFEVGAWRRI